MPSAMPPRIAPPRSCLFLGESHIWSIKQYVGSTLHARFEQQSIPNVTLPVLSPSSINYVQTRRSDKRRFS